MFVTVSVVLQDAACAWRDYLGYFHGGPIQLPRIEHPNGGIGGLNRFIPYRKIEGDESPFRPVKQTRGRTTMLHQRIPFPHIAGTFGRKTRGSNFELLANLVFQDADASIPGWVKPI